MLTIVITNLLKTLERETNILLDWFTINEMKPNADKCHLLVANQKEMTSVQLGGKVITNDQSVELLGVKIEKKLNFTEHVTKLCKKASQKLHALARISKYLSKDKLNILIESFVTSQFN